MMSKLKWIFIVGLIICLQACLFDKESESTVVKGDFRDAISGEKVANIPIEIVKCTGGTLTIRQCDSLKTIFTDSKGEFEIRLENQKEFYYQIGIGKNEFYEYTNTTVDGNLIKAGETNIISLTSSPFKILQVDVKTNKDLKNYLDIYIRTNDTKGNWLGNNILLDTSRTNQVINKRIFLKVLPKRSYIISKKLCNRTGQQIQNYSYKDCDLRFYPDFYVDNVDTTKIVLD